MNARQVEAFRAVARAGSTTAAAKAMHMSQPAISRLLTRLEHELSLKLFTRVRGGLQLTAEGAALLQDVERHFVGLEEVRRAARRIAEHGPGKLRITAFPSMTSGILPKAVARYLKDHPATAVTLDTETTDRIAAKVEAGIYDIGFTAGKAGREHAVESRILATRPWVCVFPDGHTFADSRNLSIKQLKNEPLVGFSPDMSLRFQIDELFTARQIKPNFVLSAQTIESICALVQSGCGGALIHPYAIHVARMRGLNPIRLNDAAQLELIAITAPEPHRAKIVEEFIDIVDQLLDS